MLDAELRVERKSVCADFFLSRSRDKIVVCHDVGIFLFHFLLNLCGLHPFSILNLSSRLLLLKMLLVHLLV